MSQFIYRIMYCLLLLLCVSNIQASSWKGNGTESSPFRIASIDDLRQLASDVNNGISYKGKYFILDKDIQDNNQVLDIDGDLIPNYFKLNKWVAIGSSSQTPFMGTFDGNNHTISGIFSYQIDKNGSLTRDFGLFGYISDATICNLTITDSFYYSMVFKIDGTSNLIYNCKNYGNTLAGILVYGYRGQGIIKNCGNFGKCEWAGISFQGELKIINCYNYGPISGGYSSGISSFSTCILNCVNFGKITGNDGAGISRGSHLSEKYACEICNVVNYGRIEPFPNDKNGAICSYARRYNKEKLAEFSNLYYLESSATKTCGSTGYGSYKISGDNLRMTEEEMKDLSFLEKLNFNAAALSEECCKWVKGKDGFPTLEIVEDPKFASLPESIINNQKTEMYFSIDGRKVNNPSNGIYIVVSEGKSTKRVFK